MSSPRELPSVDQVVRNIAAQGLPRAVVVNQVRSVLAARRAAVHAGSVAPEIPIEDEVIARLEALNKRSLRRVINATGVILHTNLGRAPLPFFAPIEGYLNLEYDLSTGKRGKRDVHTATLLEALLGRPAIVVNNNAAAVYLVLNELAAGGEVIVSRGELIEIGDGFRIPDIIARSGVVLREIGTTNRTTLDDYREAINARTKLILRVHPSNFHISGFTARPHLTDLAALGRQSNIPVYEDLGSGCLIDLRPQGIEEPLVSESFHAGINLVTFSCDKLLGGPQSGIIAGDAELVGRIRRNPMYRAFRVDKLIVQALQNVLQHLVKQDWQAIPALRMCFATLGEIAGRAERIASALPHLPVVVRQSETAIGGGSTPNQTLPTWVVELQVPNAAAFERKLRLGATPVIVRIERDAIILDVRTVAEDELETLVSAVQLAAV